MFNMFNDQLGQAQIMIMMQQIVALILIAGADQFDDWLRVITDLAAKGLINK